MCSLIDLSLEKKKEKFHKGDNDEEEGHPVVRADSKSDKPVEQKIEPKVEQPQDPENPDDFFFEIPASPRKKVKPRINQIFDTALDIPQSDKSQKEVMSGTSSPNGQESQSPRNDTITIRASNTNHVGLLKPDENSSEDNVNIPKSESPIDEVVDSANEVEQIMKSKSQPQSPRTHP